MSEEKRLFSQSTPNVNLSDCYQIDPGYIRYMLHSASNNKPSKGCAYSIWDDLTPVVWVSTQALTSASFKRVILQGFKRA